LQGAKYGAIGGATLGALNITALGAAYIPDREYGDFGRNDPVYRRGTFISKALFPGGGVALGRNLVTNSLDESKNWQGNGENINPLEYNNYLRAHETGHYDQQIKMGFSRFYARTLGDYLQHRFRNVYGIPGTLEYAADRYALSKVGYYFYKGRKYTR